MKLIWAFIAVCVLLWGAVANASCYIAGHSCGGATTTQCCVGLACAQDVGSTSKHCVATVPTTSTTLPTGCVGAGTNCSTDQHVVCCAGLHCAQGAGQTFPSCEPFGTTSTTVISATTTTIGGQTTTTSTATTTTRSVSTTTTTLFPPPTNSDYSFVFSPTDLGALLTKFHLPCAYTGDLPDPRTGLPANQALLSTMGWEFMMYSMEAVSLANAFGIPFNEQQIKDANFKFGGDYVLLHQAFPAGGAYSWMQPTYVRQYTCAPIVAIAVALRDIGALPLDLAQVAGLDTSGIISAPPDTMDARVLDGLLHYTPGYYQALTPGQCDALQYADDAHTAHDMALLAHDYQGAIDNNPANLSAQRAFEATALDVNEANLFKWLWDGNYNFGNPVEVRDGLTRHILDDHHHATHAFNCATHEPPDVGHILHYMIAHNFDHDCRATTHWLDSPLPFPCDTTQIQSCPKMTCRQRSAS